MFEVTAEEFVERFKGFLTNIRPLLLDVEEVERVFLETGCITVELGLKN